MAEDSFSEQILRMAVAAGAAAGLSWAGKRVVNMTRPITGALGGISRDDM